MTVGTLNGRQALLSTANTYYTGTASGTYRTIISVGQPSTSGFSTTFANPANTDFSNVCITAHY